MPYDDLKFWPALSRHGHSLLNAIAESWIKLIDDPSTNERNCLSYLSENAGFFFRDQSLQSAIVISELRLGANFRVDFMQPAEGYSRGPTYTLLEVESPNESPYDARGYPTRRLSDALQQIMDWRSWINAHRVEAMELFPSDAWHHSGAAKFQYRIIIGRRRKADRYRDKLNLIAEQNNVEIRSYDYLTDLMKENTRSYFPLFCPASSAQIGRMDKLTKNSLASPFICSLKDSDWRYIMRSLRSGWICHLFPEIAEGVITRLENSPLIAEFDRIWANLSEGQKDRLYELQRAYYFVDGG